jgi:hypothetical protein
VIVDIGLGGILEIDNILFVNRDFSQWLLQRVDCSKAVLKIGENGTVSLTQLQVSSILGIRYGGSVEIKRGEGSPTMDEIRNCRTFLGIEGSSEEITVTELVAVLMDKCSSPITDSDRIRLQVGFVMLCCIVFFSRRNKRYVIPKDGYEMVKDPGVLNRLNWGKYVVDEILIGDEAVQKAINQGRKRFNVYGCLLFLQVCIPIIFRINKFNLK